MTEVSTSTQLLYLESDRPKSFEATVVSVDKETETIVLDATDFYPTGGHQHCDQGRIEKDRSTYVVIGEVKMDDAGRVVHKYVASKGHLSVGDRVTGTVEADRRLHHMQLHTAQHILSQRATTRFGTSTGRADFGPTGGMVVLDPPLTETEAALLEDDVNRIIRDARPVSRSIKGDRVTVTVDELGGDPCRGTHVDCTSDIEMFKISGMDGKVVYYETGEYARRVATRQGNHAQAAARELQLGDTRELAGEVRRLKNVAQDAKEKLAQWQTEATAREVTTARGTIATLDGCESLLLRIDLSHLNTKVARDLLKKELTEAGQIWLCLASGRSLLVSSSTGSVLAKEVVEEFVGRWGMQGGGNQRFAQAGPIPGNVVEPLAEVVTWLTNRSINA